MLHDLIETLQHAQRAIKENGQLDVEVKALEEKVTLLENENSDLEEKLESAYRAVQEAEDSPSFETTFLGIDTLNWHLDNGNLIIQQRMESFIESLQKEFSASAVSY